MQLTSFKPIFVALSLAVSSAAHALTINPTLYPVLGTGTNNANLSPTQISEAHPELNLGSLSLLYKSEVGGADSGTFANSYNTAFLATPNDPSGAIISYINGTLVPTADPLYLYVKDGNSNPAYYLFDISDWNGVENLVLENFWPQQGAISNLQILGGTVGGAPGPRPIVTPGAVPDGGSTVALLGAGLALLALLRRKFLG